MTSSLIVVQCSKGHRILFPLAQDKIFTKNKFNVADFDVT